MAKSLGYTGEFFSRRDEWRKHPMLTKQFRHATPGLGIAVVAFGIYLTGLQKAFHDCRTRQSVYQLKEQNVVAFGGREAELRKAEEPREGPVAKSLEELPSLSNAFSDSSKGIKRQESEASLSSREQSEKTATMPVSDPSQEKDIKEPPVSEKPRGDHHKRTQDTLAAAEECFLARKKAKEQ